jgi:hypothetical protein
LAVRASGGAVLAAGRSLRGRGLVARYVEVAVVSVFHLYVVRDTRSATVLVRPLDNAPDLAFENDLGLNQSMFGRSDVVFSLRGDRPVSVDGLRAVIESLKASGLRPLLVTQVKRDDAQHRDLAANLGISAVLWGDHTHAEQLHRVRSAYSEAGAVVSNRLHALIFGIQHDASPIAVLDHASDKLTSTLRPWMTLRTTTPDFAELDGVPWDDVDIIGPEKVVRDEAERARRALEEVRVRFVSLLEARRPGSSQRVDN